MDVELMMTGFVVGFISTLLFGVRGFCVAIALVALATVFLVEPDEHADASHERTVYCKMTETWEKEAKLGIAPEDRSGWPPFDGDCNG